MIKRKIVPFIILISILMVFISTLNAQHDSDEFNKSASKALEITRITPSGVDVPSERQIVFKFNMPVVAVGRMERTSEEIPITIKPSLKGQWRWLNTSTLALQLDNQEHLKQATTYGINIQPGFVTVEGNRMKEGISHEFTTVRPQVRYQRFMTWKAPGHPVIRLDFNQKVVQSSVIPHIFFKIRNGGTIPGIEGEQVSGNFGTSVIVEPATELPLDTEIHLSITPGISSKEGPELGIENRILIAFDTFPEFRFLGLKGYDNRGKEIFLSTGDKNKKNLNPLSSISLLFSTPVPPRMEGPKLVIQPDLAGDRTDYDPWADTSTGSYFLQRPHKKDRKYSVNLPEILKAAQQYKINIPIGFNDIFGRSLEQPVNINFQTDHRPPNLQINNTISVLEKNEDTHVPLTITNIKEVRVNYRLIDEPKDFWYLRDLLGCEPYTPFMEQRVSFKTEAVEDIAYLWPLKLRNIMENQSGAITGILSSSPKIKRSCPIKFFSQVTNLAVHVKLGHYNSMVWVTGMNDGFPVKDAKAELFLYNKDEPATFGITDENGIAILKGTVDVDPYLESLKNSFYNSFGVIRVSTDNDSAIIPMTWEFTDNDYYINNNIKFSHMRAWGTTSQGIYKAGDTIDFKLYVRNQSNKKFIQPELLYYELEIKDPTGKIAYKKENISLSEFGSYHGSYTVPKNATSGWYRFYLKGVFGEMPKWEPLKVMVTDFAPAPFKVLTDIRGQLFKINDQVKVSTSAQLHSGGPYGKASARVTAVIKPTYFKATDPELKKFQFMNYGFNRNKRQIFQEEKQLDDQGDLSSSFILKQDQIVCGNLIVESAVRDDRGKYIASSSSAKFMGRDRLVGLHIEEWIPKEDEEAEFQVVVVDEHGKPISDTEIIARVEYDRVTGTRVKGAGNAYLMQYTHNKETVKEFILNSSGKPLTCHFTPKEPGSYKISANIKDTSGYHHSVYLEKYAVGKGRILWEMPDDNSLTMIPAQDEYKVGDTARFMVKNPFPGAKALITIERLGIIKQWTEIFQGNTPLIEVNIEPDFLPGFYLSVVVHSERVDKPTGENNVDLGKPTCRIGYQRVEVMDPYKQLNIIARPDKEVYKPGNEVNLDISVSDIHNEHPETEVAIVVLDEAVLDLIKGGTSYYDPYKGFYRLGALDMQNYNLLFRLIGRQKFEEKGASPGGGGGPDIKMRSLFKYVSYWNPHILPDKNGNASVRFSLPDNLTGWRVLAFAVTKDDLMGLGQSRFVTNKFTEIRPALPNQVTEGDSFDAGFTVMNRTDKTRTLSVEIKAFGKGVEAETLVQTIKTDPYIRNKIFLPTKVHDTGKVSFSIVAGDNFDQDGLTLPLQIYKKQAIEAAATYGTTTKNSISENFEFPKNMRSDTGRVSVVVSPAIISSLEGAFRYMKEYPYHCWEQRLSKGILAMHYLNLKQYIPESLEWKDAKSVIKKMINDARSFQAPNGGMCYYTPRDDYVSPYLSAYTAIAFNWLKESRYEVDADVENALHNYLQQLLRRDSLPSFFSRGMTSTVRAVALAALAQNGKAKKSDLERYLPHVEYMDLFGKAHYLMAAIYLDGKDSIKSKVYDMIMSHANETGGKVIFTDSIWGENLRDSGFDRILSSDIRTNAAVLSCILAMEEGYQTFSSSGRSDQKISATSTDTAFKIIRFLTQSRKNRDHWENTQENAFCMHALTTFSRIYDNVSVDYVVTASMDNESFGKATFNNLRDPPKKFERPVKEGDPGRKTKVVLNKEGSGRLYYAARLFYSPKELKLDPINSGIEIHREYYLEKDGRWLLLDETPMSIMQGDLIKVDLFVSIPAARNFVVVADPIPGGLEPVNRDLATASEVDADKATGTFAGSSFWYKYGDWRAYGYSRWSFYHREMLHHSVRFYSDYLPAGNYHLSYVAQAIAPGEFYVMPVHVEEMYDPDVFGQGIPSVLKVERGE